MLTISKPLSTGQAQAYHSKEFTSAEQAYYNQQGQVRGEWHGRLAEEWGLKGEVSEEQFNRLANGQHPETGEQLVRHRESFTMPKFIRTTPGTSVKSSAEKPQNGPPFRPREAAVPPEAMHTPRKNRARKRPPECGSGATTAAWYSDGRLMRSTGGTSPWNTISYGN
jgi:hypothetical protein